MILSVVEGDITEQDVDAVAPIANHVAFYPDLATVVVD